MVVCRYQKYFNMYEEDSRWQFQELDKICKQINMCENKQIWNGGDFGDDYYELNMISGKNLELIVGAEIFGGQKNYYQSWRYLLSEITMLFTNLSRKIYENNIFVMLKLPITVSFFRAEAMSTSCCGVLCESFTEFEKKNIIDPEILKIKKEIETVVLKYEIEVLRYKRIIKIQRQWRECMSNPDYSLCKRRLMREFNSLH